VESNRIRRMNITDFDNSVRSWVKGKGTDTTDFGGSVEQEV